jgi:hypothetical protein
MTSPVENILAWFAENSIEMTLDDIPDYLTGTQKVLEDQLHQLLEVRHVKTENQRLQEENRALLSSLARRHIDAEVELRVAQTARDENGKRILELRDRVFELEAKLKETE